MTPCRFASGSRCRTLSEPCYKIVELRGLEPLTFSLRTRRATDCAIAPRSGGMISTQTLPPSGGGRLPRFPVSGHPRRLRGRGWSICDDRPFVAWRRSARTGQVDRAYGSRCQGLGNIRRHGDRNRLPQGAWCRGHISLDTCSVRIRGARREVLATEEDSGFV